MSTRYGPGSWSGRRLTRFHGRHKRLPVFSERKWANSVLTPIYSPPRETSPNAVGFTLAAMREEVAAAVETLRAHGDRHIHYVDGLRLFGSDLAGHLPDELHPDAEGYRLMGANVVRDVATPLFV